MTSHLDVAKAFVQGRKAKGSRMFTDGRTCWSYGDHFPIAYRFGGFGEEKFLFNTDKYSSSTSHHQSYVERAILGSSGSIIECNTTEIRNAASSSGEAVVITKTVQHSTVEACLENVREVLKEKGLQRPPIKKVLEMLKDWELIKSI